MEGPQKFIDWLLEMYRHDEDSNVAMNDTLESVVRRALGRN